MPLEIKTGLRQQINKEIEAYGIMIDNNIRTKVTIELCKYYDKRQDRFGVMRNDFATGIVEDIIDGIVLTLRNK